jgi:flagellar hook assembly protein FlgD
MQVGQLALYSPTPNPFNNTTRVAYAVNGGTSERVDIGIYNVAGRLVRKLVSGMAAPGYHEATWDGRSDAGVQVTPGVYFLRAFVGNERITGARILYMR